MHAFEITDTIWLPSLSSIRLEEKNLISFLFLTLSFTFKIKGNVEDCPLTQSKIKSKPHVSPPIRLAHQYNKVSKKEMSRWKLIGLWVKVTWGVFKKTFYWRNYLFRINTLSRLTNSSNSNSNIFIMNQTQPVIFSYLQTQQLWGDESLERVILHSRGTSNGVESHICNTSKALGSESTKLSVQRQQQNRDIQDSIVITKDLIFIVSVTKTEDCSRLSVTYLLLHCMLSHIFCLIAQAHQCATANKSAGLCYWFHNLITFNHQ